MESNTAPSPEAPAFLSHPQTRWREGGGSVVTAEGRALGGGGSPVIQGRGRLALPRSHPTLDKAGCVLCTCLHRCSELFSSSPSGHLR